MSLSYSNLYNKLQFDVYEHEIPNIQASIDAIDDSSQREELQRIRDRKINQESNAITYKYYDIPRAIEECKRCIYVLQTLNFNVNIPKDLTFLHNDDVGNKINTEVVTIQKDKNGKTLWIVE